MFAIPETKQMECNLNVFVYWSQQQPKNAIILSM